MTISPARILVVDDNEGLRENLAEALLLEGYEAALAADGVSALEMLERQRFDAVVLDLFMPGMDGRDVLLRIRGDPRLVDLPVIVSTGHSGARARAGLEADAFLNKPYGIEQLLAALREVGLPATADDAA